ncbi:MAG: DUF5683 domain-containing protein [Cytophagales bacterium]
MNYVRLVFLSFFYFLFAVSFSQNDTTKAINSLKKETIVKKKTGLSKPQKAAIFSAILPGLGQGYNKSYWKIPLVYGAIGGFAYATYFYQKEYKKVDYVYTRITSPKKLVGTHTYDGIKNDTAAAYAEFSQYSTSQLSLIRTTFHDRRDRFLILTIAMYFANIIEAHVDAHLKDFNVSEDVALRIRPDFVPTPHGINSSLSFNFYFKNKNIKYENSSSRLW